LSRETTTPISHSPIRDTYAPRRKDRNFHRRSDKPSDRETIVSAEWRVCNKNNPIRYLDPANREQPQSQNWYGHIRRPGECKEIKQIWRLQVGTLLDLQRQN